MKQKIAFLLLNNSLAPKLIRTYYTLRYYGFTKKSPENFADASVQFFSHETAYQEFYEQTLNERMPGRHNCSDRLSFIKPFLLRLTAPAKILDIGPATGYFMHAIAEETPHYATGFESSFRFATFLEQNKKTYNLNYSVLNGDVLKWGQTKHAEYDIVLALSIFHHFLKEQALFERLTTLLENLEVEYMVFEPHKDNESQMQNIYRSFSEEEFLSYVQTHANLPHRTLLGTEPSNGRNVYVLSKDPVNI